MEKRYDTRANTRTNHDTTSASASLRTLASLTSPPLARSAGAAALSFFLSLLLRLLLTRVGRLEAVWPGCCCCCRRRCPRRLNCLNCLSSLCALSSWGPLSLHFVLLPPFHANSGCVGSASCSLANSLLQIKVEVVVRMKECRHVLPLLLLRRCSCCCSCCWLGWQCSHCRCCCCRCRAAAATLMFNAWSDPPL